MKIGIIGLGPVGQILAVHIKEAGYDVSLCDVDIPKIDLIRKEGISLKGTFTKTALFENVYSSIGELASNKPDLLIFSIKSHHIPSIINDFSHLNNVCVISAQNGIDTEKQLAEVFGNENTLRMVINFAGNLTAPNVINITFFNPPNYIASIDDSKEKIAKQFAEILNSTGLDIEVVNSTELVKKVWYKTILNVSLSALCGFTNLTMKEIMDQEDMVEIVRQILEEAALVAEAEGIHFEDDFTNNCLKYLKNTGHHLPSLAVDMLNNRVTEIDNFNGKIVEYGKKHNVSTPVNLAFTNMIKAITMKKFRI